ncbi:hypothetical protein TNCV_779601 [Trichonephila clavipes]|nr:hypothetical protein TNCV_779601 [Trichonephila clavipes]
MLLKVFTTTCTRTYSQKSSGRPDSHTAWNSLRSRRFLACHISSSATNIRAMRFSAEGTGVSYTPNSEEVHALSNTSVVVQPFNKMFSTPLMCCCFCSFSLLLCTVAQNYGIYDSAFLWNSESSLYPLHTLHACRSGSKSPWIVWLIVYSHRCKK